MDSYALPLITLYYQRKFAPISDEVKAKATYTLLQTQHVDDYVFNEISNYISESYEKKGCCVLYAVSEKFSALCARLKIDIGKREVIITQYGSILFTNSYLTYPILTTS